MLLTAAIALLAGLLCRAMDTPAPFLLGSLFGVWLAGGLMPSLRSRLGVPRWVHIPTVIGLGVLVGAMFNPEIIHHMGSWISTVIAMAGATLLATLVGFVFLTRVRDYEGTLALLCCLPGGQAEIVAVSRDLVEKDYVVALCHLVRVAMVFCITPLLLSIMYGKTAVVASNVALESLPGLDDLTLQTIAVFTAVALSGYLLARLIRFPMPHLLGPLLFSAILHLAGIVQIPRISEFVLLAQIVIGGAIGARLAQVPVRKLAGYLVDALANSVLVISVYILTAMVLSQLISKPVSDLLLSFVPGGLYEVTLLALIFGFDVAFVTFHHTVRVLLIFFLLPWLTSLAGRGGKKH